MLMSLDDVAEFLRTGRGRARTWLTSKGIAPAIELGRGKGGGPRYMDEQVLRAVEDEVAAGRMKWNVQSIFDGSLAQAMGKLGRGNGSRKGGRHGGRAQG